MVVTEDALTDRETEACAAGAVRQEGFEDVGLYAFWNAGAVIADDEGCLLGIFCT